MLGYFSKSIIRRFNFSLLIISSIALIFFAALIGFYNYHRSINELEEKTTQTLNFMKISLKDPLWNVDYRVLASISDTIMHDPDIISVVIFDEEQKILVSKIKPAYAHVSYDLIQEKDLYFLKTATVEKKQRVVGGVKIIISTEKVRYLIKKTFVIILICTAIWFFLLWLVITLIGNRCILKPIRELQESAFQFAQGNWKHEIMINRNDELGALAKSFMFMSQAIRRKIVELKILNQAGESFAEMHNQNHIIKSALNTIQEPLSFFWGGFWCYKNYQWEFIIDNANNQELVNMINDFNPFSAIDEVNSRKKNYIIYYKKEYLKGNKNPLSILMLPIYERNFLLGVMIFVGHPETVCFKDNQKEFVLTISRLTSITMKNIQMFDAIEEHRANLEKIVEERTYDLKKANQDLRETLEQLQQMQNQLVEAEKMAALGKLVAGIAHEINTPIGIAVTASSYLNDNTEQILEIYNENKIKRSELEEYLNQSKETTEMILSNLQRASNLIHSFKKVAVDQSNEEVRIFNIKNYINDILFSMHSKLKKVSHKIIVKAPDKLEINSYPGLFSQIITNLIINSLIHAFDNKKNGEITITVKEVTKGIHIIYQDNGKGITPENLKQIFDPFFTTNRLKGGSGLGLHIIYNIVTQKLGGTIQCQSEIGHGVQFDIIVPTLNS